MKEKKQTMTDGKWLRPEDIAVMETSDPKEMLNRWLVEPACREWTEEFTNEANGEKTSVERRELIIEKGTKLSKDDIQVIMFHIQSGGMKSVKVADQYVTEVNEGFTDSFSTYSVKFLAGEDKYTYVLRARGIRNALTIAKDFGNVYLHISNFNPIRVGFVDLVIIPDDDECIPSDEQDSEPKYGKEYYRVKVDLVTCSEISDNHFKTNFLIYADEVGKARTYVMNHCNKLYAKTLHENSLNKFLIVEAVPYTVDVVVPRDFSLLYSKKQSKDGKAE